MHRPPPPHWMWRLQRPRRLRTRTINSRLMAWSSATRIERRAVSWRFSISGSGAVTGHAAVSNRCEAKSAAFSRRALYGDFSVKHLYELLTDRQPQPATAVAPGDGGR